MEQAPHPIVELLISGSTGLLTDPVNVRLFFTTFAAVGWRLSIFYADTGYFSRIKVPSLLALIEDPRRVSDQATMQYLIEMRNANQSRQEIIATLQGCAPGRNIARAEPLHTLPGSL